MAARTADGPAIDEITRPSASPTAVGTPVSRYWHTLLDRDAQFSYLNDRVGEFWKAGEPVISVDTKKKELVGEFSNGGREYHPIGEPPRVKTHDFIDKELGRAVPYGVYNLANDEGWVSVGDTADTASFAVEAVRRWWHTMGRPRFPKATKLQNNAATQLGL